MLKVPPAARTDSSGGSDASSERALARGARERARGDRFTITASAEEVGSWIGRLSYHRMTPCGLCDAQSPAADCAGACGVSVASRLSGSRRPTNRCWSDPRNREISFVSGVVW